MIKQSQSYAPPHLLTIIPLLSQPFHLQSYSISPKHKRITKLIWQFGAFSFGNLAETLTSLRRQPLA